MNNIVDLNRLSNHASRPPSRFSTIQRGIGLVLVLLVALCSMFPAWGQTSGTNKWLQIPDTSPDGLDVKATDPKQLADDFLCTATGPITQVRIWGSWRFDEYPSNTPPFFSVGIWTDVPVSPTNFFSRPGDLVCGNFFEPGTYSYSIYASNLNEQFFDPNSGTIIGVDTVIWEYVFNLTNSCWQTNGNIYWVSVNATGFDTNLYLFGWKTCPTNWNDDAVFRDVNTVPAGPWLELRRPPFFTNSLDLAFEIITSTNQEPQTGDTNKWLQIPDTSTNGLDVLDTDPKFLADDFLCTATGPISQIRVWGSWLDDRVATNPCFGLGIWTDVPVTNTVPWSRPGTQLCIYYFLPGQYSAVLYTNVFFERFWDPALWSPAPPGTNGILGTDTQIWEYVFNIPTNFPCIQTNGNVYWLSLTANCFPTNQYLFGWKSCPTNWNDDAVWCYTTNFNQPTRSWFRMRRPGTTNTLDLSFEIITETNACTTPVSIICGTNQVVECGTSWTVTPPIVSSPCCGTNYTLTSTIITNGTCPWVITYTWQVIDCIGSTASCTQTVTMVDTTQPVLTCASNKTVQCNTTWSFDLPLPLDVCCGTNVTISVVSTVTNGCVITRTWQAADCCTNTMICSQSVTLIDTNPPTIICPSNMLVWACSTNISVTWTSTVSDDCSGVATNYCVPPPGSLFQRDLSTLVTCYAQDGCGNVAQCSFFVTVRRPRLTIEFGVVTNTVRITWESGVLQQATNVTGTWVELPSATSPYTNIISPLARFYRLRCP